VLIESTPPGADKLHFVLRELVIEGATVYSGDQLRPLFARYLGQTIDVQTAYQIAAAITQRYQQDGYVLSQATVPPQKLGAGRLKLQVVEGYVAEVQVADGQENRIVRDFVRRVLAMRPLHMPTLERMLLSLNDQEGIRVKATMLPMPEQQAAPGAVAMQLAVDRTPAGGQVTFGNDSSRYIGPWQGSASGRLRDQLLAFDQLSVKAVTTTHAQELHYGEVQYHAPLNADGTTAGLSASLARSVPGSTLAPLQLSSDSSSLRAEAAQALIRTRLMTLSATVGLEHKEVSADLLQSKLYRDRLTVATGRVFFNTADRLGGVNLADATVRQGLNTPGTRKTGSPNLSRVEGHSDFTSVTGTLSRLQTISGPWQVNAFATGQYAFSPLLASEQFGFGGASYGRAYDPSELTGDEGLAGSVELRYDAIAFERYRLSLMPFAYYDIGKVWNLVAGGQNLSAASAGAGLVIRHYPGLQLTLTLADPLTHRQANTLFGNMTSPRWLALLSYAF
jgi:hemolysin activation/secretion protein